MEEEQLCYLPPRMEKGVLQLVVMVSDGTLVVVELDASPVTTLGPEPQCEEAPADPVQADVVVEEECGEQVVRE